MPVRGVFGLEFSGNRLPERRAVAQHPVSGGLRRRPAVRFPCRGEQLIEALGIVGEDRAFLHPPTGSTACLEEGRFSAGKPFPSLADAPDHTRTVWPPHGRSEKGNDLSNPPVNSHKCSERRNSHCILQGVAAPVAGSTAKAKLASRSDGTHKKARRGQGRGALSLSSAPDQKRNDTRAEAVVALTPNGVVPKLLKR